MDDLYTTFATKIRSWTKFRRLLDIYNYEVPKVANSFPSMEFIANLFRPIFLRQMFSFKVTISLGLVLLNRETQELDYFYSSQNNQRLFNPVTITNELDCETFINDILNLDLVEHLMNQRPTSKYIPKAVTNVTFFVVKLLGIPIGSPPPDFPRHLIRNKGLYCLVSNKKTGRKYKDNLCVFRALALKNGFSIKNFERESKRLFRVYCDFLGISTADFGGVVLSDLNIIAQLFEVSINVYTQTADRATSLTFRTLFRENRMCLHQHDHHFSYIKDFSKYSTSYICGSCKKSWPSHFNYHRHIQTCDASTKNLYVSGAYEPRKNIFSRLADYGISIDETLHYYEYIICLDIESALLRDHGAQATSNVTYTHKHELASIAVCSNIPDYEEAKCFVRTTTAAELVKSCLGYLELVAAKAYAEMLDRFEANLDEIRASKLSEAFDKWLKQVPVLTFNGAKYDLKILREELIPLLLSGDGIEYTIKKTSSYACISTPSLKFLDIVNYLAAGVSYDSFLRSQSVSVNKSHFPYEWFDDLQKLNETTFPPYVAFYSSIKRRNTLEPDNITDLTSHELLLLGRDHGTMSGDEKQQIGAHRHHELSSLFYENNWIFKDFLVYYNNRDVAPFVTGVERLMAYYRTRGVCIFKEAISLPGIAQILGFKSITDPSHRFWLFSKAHKDLAQLFLNQNTGGPSIIFHRFAEAGVTKIRQLTMGDNAKLVKRIVGFDANALYLFATGQLMPTGVVVRRRLERNFIKEYAYPQSRPCCDWLAYLENQGIEIQHARNNVEFRADIGRSRTIPVDGYDRASNTIYQFHGCYFHGHTCIVANRDEIRHNTTLNRKFAATQKLAKDIENAGFNLVEMWECVWADFSRGLTIQNPYLYPTEHLFRMSQSDIIQAILNDRLFCAIECKIYVPDNLKPYFAEMPPIFKNTTVSFNDIGDYMKKYLETQGQTYKDRRYLVGSMYADKILLISALVKWYLSKGLIIDKIYQIIEFKGANCFKAFVEKVSDDRRAGDSDPRLKANADNSKTVGNCLYGYTVMNKSKHRNITYCSGPDAEVLVNDPRFESLEEFGQDCYEVSSRKKCIKYDLPMQIGFWVYSYAKLKMLEFHYDLLDKFIDRADYQLLEMDTDSLYLSISGLSLDELVKPGLRDEWLRIKDDWFPRSDTIEHAAFDRRTPGLFKIEWSGSGFIGLASKTYFCFDHEDRTQDKYSSKGLNKTLHLQREHFINILSEECHEVRHQSQGFNEDNPAEVLKTFTNRGFITKNNNIYSYTMDKTGLPFFYVKRKVLKDGISTTYLDV